MGDEQIELYVSLAYLHEAQRLVERARVPTEVEHARAYLKQCEDRINRVASWDVTARTAHQKSHARGARL